MQILLPALPQIATDFEVESSTAQLTLSLSMLAIALGTLFYGPMSDKFGRKPIMLVGLLITLVGSIFCYYSTTIETLIASRFVQAFGGAVGLVLARAIVRDSFEPEEAARVIATLVMVMVVIPMLSPALGGELMNWFGWQSVFLVVAVGSLIMMLFTATQLQETLVEPVQFEGVVEMLKTYAKLLKSDAFRGYALCVSFVSVVFFSFIAAAPEIMVSTLQRPPTEYGYYFVIIPLGFMLGNNVARRFVTGHGPDTMIARGAIVGIAGVLLALALQLAGIQHPIALFAPVALAVFGNGISLPIAQAAAINEFPEMAGSASGLTGFLQMALSAIAAQVVALIYNGTAIPLLILMLSAATLSYYNFHKGARS